MKQRIADMVPGTVFRWHGKAYLVVGCNEFYDCKDRWTRTSTQLSFRLNDTFYHEQLKGNIAEIIGHLGPDGRMEDVKD